MKKNTKSTEELLALRKKIKSYKPDFIRHEGHKKKRLAKVWRKPRGLHNKVREHRRGYVRNLTPGYGSPLAVKGLHASGLVPIIVTHLAQLKTMDKAKEGIIISATVGVRKKLLILQEAEKLHLKILNIDPVKFKTRVEAKRKQHDELKKQLEEKKKHTEKELEKKVKTKEAEEKVQEKEETKDEKDNNAKTLNSEEDLLRKKEEERREAEKVIIHKK